MQVGVKALNSEVFFKKLRKPLDDRFLLFRAVAAAKAGDGRQDLVNIRAGRFERTVAERIGRKAIQNVARLHKRRRSLIIGCVSLWDSIRDEP